MNAKTNAQGKDRKNLVKAIAGITGQAAKYNGAPAFTYTVGNFTVERDGSITTEDEAGIKTLAVALREQGFEIEMPEITEEPKTEETETPAEEEMTTDSWTLTMPRADFTETQIDNLEKIIASKANLIKKALDCDDPTVILVEDRVVFPWFKRIVFRQAFFPIFVIPHPHCHHRKFPTFSSPCQDTDSTTASCRIRACSIR